MWKINFNVLLVWLLPLILRFAMFIEYMQVAFSQLNLIYKAFKSHRNEVNIDLRYECSVADLEYRLRQTFYNTNITISNNNLPGDTFIFSDNDENVSVYVFTDSDHTINPALPIPYLFSDSASSLLSDFTVNVPSIVFASDLTISGLVEKYKPTGKTFNINRI